MIRKGKPIAKLLIVLSGIVFLAHTLIPHHHHDKQVCIETDHCANHTQAYACDQEEPGHQHDSQNNPKPCCVGEFVPVLSKSTNKSSNYQNSGHNNYPDFTCLLLHDNSRIPAPLAKVFDYEPEFVPFYTSLVCVSVGLRAPPVV